MMLFPVLPRAAGYKNKTTAIFIAREALDDGRHRNLPIDVDHHIICQGRGGPGCGCA
jgi:hypothetical protein